jgi:ubiquinone/menaquinone biosynthesis C-methylase UbiE
MQDVLFIENPRNLILMTGKESRMEAKHQALFNIIWDTYDETDFEVYVDRYKHRLKVNELMPLIERSRCLDLGCGNGNFCFALADLGAEFAAGIDFGQESIKYANERKAARPGGDRTEFRVSTVYSLDYPSDAFDFIIQNGVFHHLDDENKAIHEAKRVLKKGGYFWYYTDGEGGISYDLWDRSVNLLRDVPQDYIRQILRSMNISTPKIVHIMDGMNATYRHTSWAEITSRLQHFGFGNFKRLTGGFETDSDLDVITADPYGREKFGEGDLRVLAQLVEK